MTRITFDLSLDPREFNKALAKASADVRRVAAEASRIRVEPTRGGRGGSAAGRTGGGAAGRTRPRGGPLDTLGIRSTAEINAEIRIVQAAFDRLRASGVSSQNEIARASQALETRLRRLKAELGATSERVGGMARQYRVASGAVTDLNGRLARQSRAARGAALSLSNIRTALAGAFVIQGVRAFFGAVTSASDEFRQMAARIRLVADSTEEAAILQRQVFNLAQETRTEYGATATLYTRLARAIRNSGGAQEDALTITRAVTQSLQITGASAQEAAGGARQFSQAIQAGRLNGDELRSVVENMPVIATAIAKEFGVSEQRLKDMGARGELLSSRIIPAVVKAAAEINEQFVQLPVTIGQAAVTLRNDFNRALADTDVSPLVDSMQALRETLTDPEVRRGLVDLASGFTQIAGASVQAAAATGSFFGRLNAARLGLADQLSDVALGVRNLDLSAITEAFGRDIGFEAFLSSAPDIDALNERLEDTRTVLGLLSTVGIDVPLLQEQQTALLERIAKITQEVEAQRESFVRLRAVNISTIEASAIAAQREQQAQERLTKRFKQLVNERQTAVREGLRAQESEVRQSEQRIRRLREEGRRLTESESARDLERTRTAREAIRRIEARESAGRITRDQAQRERARAEERGQLDFRLELTRRLRQAQLELTQAQRSEGEEENAALTRAREIAESVREQTRNIDNRLDREQVAQRARQLFNDTTEQLIANEETVQSAAADRIDTLKAKIAELKAAPKAKIEVDENLEQVTAKVTNLTKEVQKLRAIGSVIFERLGSTDLPSAGGFRGAQGGAVPGVGNRDSVPALLTPGEFVLPKKAARALGTLQLERLRRGVFPSLQGFAAGGLVEASRLRRKRAAAERKRSFRGRASEEGRALTEIIDAFSAQIDEITRPGRLMETLREEFASKHPDSGRIITLAQMVARQREDEPGRIISGRFFSPQPPEPRRKNTINVNLNIGEDTFPVTAEADVGDRMLAHLSRTQLKFGGRVPR